MTALLKACTTKLADYFGNQREYGTGIQGATQLLGWTFTLANEHEPRGINLWIDITNGFNTLSRSAIAEGLLDFPPPLKWLYHSFNSFYSNDIPLFFNRDQEKHIVLSQVGSMQGDPASGIFFNAGLQRAFNKIQREFPEATMAKYLDDLNVFIPPNEDGTQRTCTTTETRTMAFPNSYLNNTNEPCSSIPLACAIAHRWKLLVHEMCGLSIASKWGVCSLATPLNQHDYRNLPITNGLLIAGTPIGNEDFIRESIASVIRDSVNPTYDATTTLNQAQIMNLLARTNTCGTSRVQHLWQTITPTLTAPFALEVDDLTKNALLKIMGRSQDDLDALQYKQIFLPLRFGGLGYRSSMDIVHEAYTTRFATVAYATQFSIPKVAPFLLQDILSPENSNLPSLKALNHSWNTICERHPRIVALSKAAIRGLLCPPAPVNDDNLETNSERAFLAQESMFHTRFKSQAVLGIPPYVPSTSWQQATIIDISERAELAFNNISTPKTVIQTSQYSQPWKFPSVLKLWLEQDASKLQQTFSRITDTANLVSFVETCSELSLSRLAIFRAKQNVFSRIPLTVLPNKPERCFDNEKFQWYLADRIQAPQPTSVDISSLSCNCRPHTSIQNGRHFRLCLLAPKGNFHDKMRDELLLMCRSAGIPTMKEPTNLLPDEPLTRPGDLFIPCWTINDSVFSKHAIDFTAPSVDASWETLSGPEKIRRTSTTGIMANSAVNSKLSNKGKTIQERALRGNSLSMASRCNQQRINFWPIALEKDGCPSSSFLALLNNVCDAAGKFTDRNPATFRNYWHTCLACKFNHHIASLAIHRRTSFRRTLLRSHSIDNDEHNTLQAQMTLPIHCSNSLTPIPIVPKQNLRRRA